MGILRQDDILSVYAAVVSARMVERRATLLAGVADGFVVGLPIGVSPGDQILRDLDALNAVAKLADETVPLAIWLANALALTSGRDEAATFAEALDRVQGQIGPPLRAGDVIPGRWRLQFGVGRGALAGHAELTLSPDRTFDGTLRNRTIIAIHGAWRLEERSRVLQLDGGVFTTSIHLSKISRDRIEGSTSPGEHLVLLRLPRPEDPKETPK